MDSSGIVAIVKKTGEKFSSIGTGFFVKNAKMPGLFLTCAHVLKKANLLDSDKKIMFQFEGDSAIRSGILEAFDESVDIALVSTKSDKVDGYVLKWITPTNEGKLYTLGFAEGSLTGAPCHPSFERIAPDKLIDLRYANAISPGFSGAPLIMDGYVVAVVKIVPGSLREKGLMLDVARAIPMESVLATFDDYFNSASIDGNKTFSKQESSFAYSKEELEVLSNIVSASNNIPGQTKDVAVRNEDSTKTSVPKYARAWQFTDNAQDILGIARDTFGYLVHSWLEKTNVVEPSYQKEPLRGVLHISLPSLQPDVNDMQCFWYVYATSQKLRRTMTSNGVEVFRISLPKKIIVRLEDIVHSYKQDNEHFYFALAHNSLNTSIYELNQYAPEERFDWYCVDLTQQNVDVWKNGFIEIPSHNTLNLSTFSLLWSSLWVESFYSPIYIDTHKLIDDVDVDSVKENYFEVLRMTHPMKREASLVVDDWDSLNERVLRLFQEIGMDGFSKIRNPIGIGYSLEVIKQKLYSSASVLDTIQTYCPESLYGAASMWLFSRSYHGFMYASSSVVQASKQGNNVRILPLPDKPQNISKLMLACLWHVILLYSSLNVEVRLIHKPSIDAGGDHSYYGGGIGYFPWLSLSNDGVVWMREQNTESDGGLHRDFIQKYMNRRYNFIEPYFQTLWQICSEFMLTRNDLTTSLKCPVMLFPRQGRFIEYPHTVFGGITALRSIDAVKRLIQ